MSVDTLALARDLRAANLESAQAEAIAAAIGLALSEGAASKADISALRAEATQNKIELRAEIAELRAEATQNKIELRAEIAELRSEMQALEQRMIARIEGLRSSLIMWFIATQLAFSGLIIAVVKFL